MRLGRKIQRKKIFDKNRKQYGPSTKYLTECTQNGSDVWEFVHNFCFCTFFFLMFASYERQKNSTEERKYMYPGTQSPLMRKYRDTHRARSLCVWPWVVFAVFIEYHLFCRWRALNVVYLFFSCVPFRWSMNSFGLPFLLCFVCWELSSTYLKPSSFTQHIVWRTAKTTRKQVHMREGCDNIEENNISS